MISNKYPSQALHIVRSQMRILPTKKVPQIFVFWDASPKARDASRVRTHAHPTAILLFCCHKYHRGRKMRVQFVPLKVLFFQKQRVVFNKTTCHFQQNNVSFSTKQRVAFKRTTWHFQQNNVLFVKVRRLSLSSLYELQNLFFGGSLAV